MYMFTYVFFEEDSFLMVACFFRTPAIFLIPIQYTLFSIPLMKTFQLFLSDWVFYLVFRWVIMADKLFFQDLFTDNTGCRRCHYDDQLWLISCHGKGKLPAHLEYFRKYKDEYNFRGVSENNFYSLVSYNPKRL